MENIIMPKYSEGDIIRLNPKELGQVYTTYRQFFKLYNFNDENYSTNNLIEDYINVDFMIEHIAPHHIDNIPLYVIVTEACKIRFLVNEPSRAKEILPVSAFMERIFTFTLSPICRTSCGCFSLPQEISEMCSKPSIPPRSTKAP